MLCGIAGAPRLTCFPNDEIWALFQKKKLIGILNDCPLTHGDLHPTDLAAQALRFAVP